MLLVLAIQKQNAPPPTDVSAGLSGLGVAFIADGYTSGSPAGGQGPANYTALLAGRYSWRMTNEAAYGYVAGLSPAAQLSAAVAADPTAIVVSGGRADAGRDAVRDAATAARIPFVDPIADRWFDGRDADGITPDDDLSDRGHQRRTDLVDDALRRSGAQP